MKRYRELQESLAPRKVGKNRNGSPVYAVGNRYFVVSYSSLADETAVFLAKNAAGDVTDYGGIVSVKGSVGDAEMIRMAVAEIATGRIADPEDRQRTEADRAVSRWEGRIAQMERHIEAATRQLETMKTDLASAQKALEAGNYRIVQTLTDFRPGSKPWER
jgi:hypothetical protein